MLILSLLVFFFKFQEVSMEASRNNASFHPTPEIASEAKALAAIYMDHNYSLLKSKTVKRKEKYVSTAAAASRNFARLPAALKGQSPAGSYKREGKMCQLNDPRNQIQQQNEVNVVALCNFALLPTVKEQASADRYQKKMSHCISPNQPKPSFPLATRDINTTATIAPPSFNSYVPIKSQNKIKNRENIEEDNNRIKNMAEIIPAVELTETDKKILMCSTGWLEETHINFAMELMQKAYPQFGGMNSLYFPSFPRVNVNQPYVQISLTQNNHWICFSNIVRKPVLTASQKKVVAEGEVVATVYDSMNRTVQTDTKTRIRELISTPHQKPYIYVASYQKQPGDSECGLFAIASSIALLSGKTPSKLCYNVSVMRAHLLKCFEERKMTPFPEGKATERRQPSKIDVL